VFRKLSGSNHATLVRWILSSMYPYMQKEQSLALWSLTCLFSAVSPDPYLQSFQPLLVSLGHQRLPPDLAWFLTASVHFFAHELQTDEDQKDFLTVCAAFTSSAPFSQLLVLCKQLVASPGAAEVYFNVSDSL